MMQTPQVCSTLSSLICSSAVIHILLQHIMRVKECFPKSEMGLVINREMDSATQHYNRRIMKGFLHNISRSGSPQEYTGRCTTITVNIFISPSLNTHRSNNIDKFVTENLNQQLSILSIISIGRLLKSHYFKLAHRPKQWCPAKLQRPLARLHGSSEHTQFLFPLLHRDTLVSLYTKHD